MRAWAITTLVMMIIKLLMMMFKLDDTGDWDWDQDFLHGLKLVIQTVWIVWGSIVIF